MWARQTFTESERSELIPHSVETQGGVLVETWDAPVFSATEKVVCEECNNGWMGALEQRAKDHAEPMLLGEPQTLNREAKVSLSMWAYLKMLLVQQVDEPVLPRESYETFYAIQGEDLLPLNTSVFIAHHVGAPGPVPAPSARATRHRYSRVLYRHLYGASARHSDRKELHGARARAL